MKVYFGFTVPVGSTNSKVILFYSLTCSDKISLLIAGNTHPNCTLVSYSSLGEAEAFIKTHVGRAVTNSGICSGADLRSPS